MVRYRLQGKVQKNQVMRCRTIVATLFVPLTLIVGAGMA